MNKLDSQLKTIYQKILDTDKFCSDRTGVGTKKIFGDMMRVDLRDGFPLTTLRKIHIKSLIHELLWFLGAYDKKYKKFGNTNIRYLLDNGVSFWTEWCYKNYKAEKLNTVKNPEKQIKILSQKDFEKKIQEDDHFALKYGDLGPVYGKQWLDFGGYKEIVPQTNVYKETNGKQHLVDILDYKEIHIKGINQINKLIETLINDPESRRLIVSAWNVTDLEDMALEPCHILFQCNTEIITIDERYEILLKNFEWDDILNYFNKININDWKSCDNRSKIRILDHFNIPERYIDMLYFMRSNDFYLGQPYNTASYALLLHILGQVTNMIPRDLVYMGGNIHLYSNSIEATEELLKRDIKPLPKLVLNNDIEDITKFRFEDFTIIDYFPHPNIKVDVAV